MPSIIATYVERNDGHTVVPFGVGDTLFITQAGIVNYSGPAIPTYAAVFTIWADVRIGVAGTVISANGFGVWTDGANTVLNVTSTGTILSMSAAFNAVLLFGGNGRVYNDGTIMGNQFAIGLGGSTGSVFNTGLIAGGSTGVAGATLVENLGTIRGATAVSMSGGNDVLINRGTLVGNVALGDGSDLFDGFGGTVTGTVDGGAGDDVYRLSDPLVQVLELPGGGIDRVEATVSWDLGTAAEVENLTLLGGADLLGLGNILANDLRGNIGANQLFGIDGNDTLYGFGGDDLLDGGLGNDTMFGGIGDDRLRGRDGDDRLAGGSDEDRLFGGAGGDTLGGGDGNDLIVGGAGRDVLNGGLGDDQFIYLRQSDTGTVAATRDTILDFTADQDVIDLSALDANSVLAGNQAFVYIGAVGFGAIAGQVRLAISATDAILEGDVDGNGVADFRIALAGVTVLAGSDLVL